MRIYFYLFIFSSRWTRSHFLVILKLRFCYIFVFYSWHNHLSWIRQFPQLNQYGLYISALRPKLNLLELKGYLCMVEWGSGNKRTNTSTAVYLSAVQIQILISNFQLQNFHLVVPLLYYRGVPHRTLIQSWFSPTHYLHKDEKKSLV